MQQYPFLFCTLDFPPFKFFISFLLNMAKESWEDFVSEVIDVDEVVAGNKKEREDLAHGAENFENDYDDDSDVKVTKFVTCEKKPSKMTDEKVRSFVETRLRCLVYSRRYYMGRDALARILRSEFPWLKEWEEKARKEKKDRGEKVVLGPSKLTEFVGDFLKKQMWWQTTRAQARERPTVPYVTSEPRERLQIDLIGPMGNCADRYGLVVMDLFTRRAWTYKLKEKNAKKVWGKMKLALTDMFGKRKRATENDKLTKRQKRSRELVMNRESRAIVISSDQGGEFLGDFSREVEKGWAPDIRIEQSFGTSYRSTNQAYVERLNKTLKTDMFKMQVGQRSRCLSLDLVTKIYNEAKAHSAFTPRMTPEEAEKMSLEGGDKGMEEVRKRLERRLKVRLKTKGGQRGLKMPVAKEGDFVRLRIPKENKHHFYTDNWSSVVYRVRSRRDPQPLIGFPSTQTRRVYTIENADTGELKTNKAGAAMEYTAFELLKIPTRQDDDGTLTYHAQILPNLSKQEMKEICGKCSIDKKDATKLVEESEVIQPEEEVDLDKLPIMKKKPSLREAFEEIDAEIGKAEEKYVALILGLKRLLLNNEWFEDGPAWPIPMQAQKSREIVEIVNAVEVSVTEYLEPGFKDIRDFAFEMKKTKHLENVLKEYLSGGVIAKNMGKESNKEYRVSTVAPLGQRTVLQGLKKLDAPEKVKVSKEKETEGHFAYTFRDEPTVSPVDKAPSEHFYFFSTSDNDKIIIPIYWGARLALESVLFTPENSLFMERNYVQVNEDKSNENHILPADNIRETLQNAVRKL